MPTWLHRTTKQLLTSVPADGLIEPVANFIEEPNLTTVAGQPSKYWVITGDAVTLMDAAARAAVDAALLDAARDAVAAEFDQLEGALRAFMGLVLQEFNDHTAKTNAILDAIDAATNLASLKTAIAALPDLPVRTFAQLKTGIRNRLGS